MFEMTTQNWNDLVNGVNNIADKTQSQLVRIRAYLNELNSTLTTTNIILAIIASALIALVIIELIKFKKVK
ncbi:hypothetical protein ACS127_14190 [Amphibacillus sp. Q70]|uniref:hypothetical protein n=1 Tax=Amphibacillus sp. Q70 TaxID=3453416 RepID=UPI003F841918